MTAEGPDSAAEGPDWRLYGPWVASLVGRSVAELDRLEDKIRRPVEAGALASVPVKYRRSAGDLLAWKLERIAEARSLADPGSPPGR